MKRHTIFYILLVLFATSCKKFITLEEAPTAISAGLVFQYDATAVAAQTAVFSDMRSLMQGQQGLAFVTALSADELVYFGTYDQRLQIYTNSLSPQNTEVSLFWQNAYNLLYQANSVIEGLGKSSSLSMPVRNQVLGEALFSRAFLYFHLVNLYGDVPLILNTNYEQNKLAFRAPVADIYEQILKDLETAAPLLTESYLSGLANPTEARIRPNRATAHALLAKVNLYIRNWAKAEDYATRIVAEEQVYQLAPLSDVFTAGSQEAIWQLDGGGQPTLEESVFPLVFSSELNPSLVDAFDNMDARKDNWIGLSDQHYYAYKYKETQNDNFTVFRLAEILLIRAEARAQQGNLLGANGAEADVNAIRLRAGLLPAEASSKADMLQEIELQRKLELFCEMGNRWFDLKRLPALGNQLLTRADELIPALNKPGEWKSTAKLYPIPQSDRRSNPNLSQNPGYGE